MSIRRIVLDALIPHSPDILQYAQQLSDLPGTRGVTIDVLENDERTRTIEITIEGESLIFTEISKVIEDIGGSIHSIDQVSAGANIIAPSEHRGE
jgi:hypothetical protein